MRSLWKMKADSFPSYRGLEWERKISNPNEPNFWKYGVANLIFLNYVKDKKLVLDLGCGTGGSTFFVAEHGEAEWIIGVDLVSDMIKVAKKKAANRGLDQKISFVVCDGRYLPFKASFFKALISRGDVFCFLVPLKEAVKEFRRVMTPTGVIVLEIDNRKNWKPGTIISTKFQKMLDGKIAYLVETFTTKRNHGTISYILDPNGKIIRKVAGDPEFKQKGCKAWKHPLQKVKEETLEIRQGVLTHWPTVKGLSTLFKKGGFTEVQVMGNGLLMKLLLDGDKAIIEAMKRNPKLFFEIEKRLIPYVNPNMAPTMILRATAP
jgi:ubiquinone/menaquinone biosynthesis C-methylase UbiE